MGIPKFPSYESCDFGFITSSYEFEEHSTTKLFNNQ